MDGNSQRESKEVAIERVPIELYQLLKLVNLAASGGEAKVAIGEGQVRVNGRVETRKRKKIIAGDLVEFAGNRVRIACPAAGSGEQSPTQQG